MCAEILKLITSYNKLRFDFVFNITYRISLYPLWFQSSHLHFGLLLTKVQWVSSWWVSYIVVYLNIHILLYRHNFIAHKKILFYKVKAFDSKTACKRKCSNGARTYTIPLTWSKSKCLHSFVTRACIQSRFYWNLRFLIHSKIDRTFKLICIYITCCYYFTQKSLMYMKVEHAKKSYVYVLVPQGSLFILIYICVLLWWYLLCFFYWN